MVWKPPTIPFGVISYTSDTHFSDNLSQKNCISYLFFSGEAITNPAISLVINVVRIFSSLCPRARYRLSEPPTTPLALLSFLINWFCLPVTLSKLFGSK